MAKSFAQWKAEQNKNRQQTSVTQREQPKSFASWAQKNRGIQSTPDFAARPVKPFTPPEWMTTRMDAAADPAVLEAQRTLAADRAAFKPQNATDIGFYNRPTEGYVNTLRSDLDELRRQRQDMGGPLMPDASQMDAYSDLTFKIDALQDNLDMYGTDLYNTNRAATMRSIESAAGSGTFDGKSITDTRGIYGIAKYLTDAEYKAETDKALMDNAKRRGTAGTGLWEVPSVFGDAADMQRYGEASTMTNQEKETLLYYLSIGDDETAQQYYDAIQRDLQKRYAGEQSDFTQDFTKEHPVTGTLMNITASLGQGAGFVSNTAQNLKNQLGSGEYEPINLYNMANAPTRMVNDTTEALTEDIKSPFGKLLAQTGLSIGQFAATLPFGSTGALAIMGTASANQYAYDALERGVPAHEAMAGATAAGVIEVLTEKIPLDELFKIADVTTFAQALKAVGKQAGMEGIEEIVNSYANSISDQIITGEKSQFNQLVASYQADGMTRDEAYRKAMLDTYVMQPLQAGFGGFLSGGFIGGGMTALNFAPQPKTRVDLATELANRHPDAEPDFAAMVEAAVQPTEPLPVQPAEAQPPEPIQPPTVPDSSYIEKAQVDIFRKAGQSMVPLSSIVQQDEEVTDAQMTAYDEGMAEAVKKMQAENAAKKPTESKPVVEKVEAPIEIPAQKVDNGTVSKPVHEQIANSVYKYVSEGQTFTAERLFEIADKAYGGTMAAGKYTVKDAYDAVELAVNKWLEKYAKSMNGDKVTARSAIPAFEKLLAALPTQTKRTAEMEEYQQFSTPPNIAYLAAWAAGITSNDTVLEPSAGIGGLAVFPKAWGAKVYANELSPRRLEFLKSMGFTGTFNFNAEQIDNLLPDDVKPSVVLMNPPFSSAAGRMTTKATANAKRHIEQALNRLEPNGRLVAIVGRGMADDSPSFSSWWNDLKQKYNIRANVRIDGKNYKKYGTNFDIQLVVIDKTGATEKTITGEYTDLTQIPTVLEGIRNDRARAENSAGSSAEQNAAVSGAPAADTGAVRDGTVSDRSDSGSVEPAGRTDNKPGSRPDNAKSPGAAVRGVKPGTGIQPTDIDAGRGGNGRVPSVINTTGTQQGSEAVTSSAGSAVESAGQRIQLDAKQPGSQRIADTQKLIENADNVYSEYAPKKLSVKGAKAHPAKLVESAAMAAVDPPDITYTPNLPQSLISSGALSIAQIENIVYAGQSHAQMLKNGTRRGYFIGDGTGVGKGRQIAGIILDNMRQGRTKAVWISKNNSLTEDARRDWLDIGGKKDDIVELGKVKLNQKISAERGILFSTFGTIKTEKADGSRIKQIEEWLGKDFDGVIVFDEAHNMANSIASEGKRGKQKAAQMALAGIKLQEAFPQARIVYASATGATKISDYAYLTRLGLWGEGTAFNSVNDFIEKISAGGLAAMELVARDMKAMGVYMARSISYDDVSYDTITHALTPVQNEIYNTMSRAWQKVLQNINSVLETTNANKNSMAKSFARSQFYGAMQRFYNQIITSMSMPSVISDIKKELDKGNSIVIQLVNTNQAAMERRIDEMDENQSLDDIDLTPSDTLKQYLEKSFPIYEYEEYQDEKGNTLSRLVTDGEGKPVISREAVRIRDELVAELDQMKVPDGPLELLIDTFGADQVAEVTGRTRRIVQKKDDDGQMRRVIEPRTTHMALADAQLFQDGKKRILVFSDAGGTGKSYHADRRAKNQQKRIHYLLQPGWNASSATQGFGRTHRSNQVSAPTFRLVTTDIMGQKRFTSTIARRLDQLGALTKGQRQAGSGVFSQKDNLESDIAKDALAKYYRSVPVDSLIKMGLYDKMYDQYGIWKPDENTIRDMGLFLNRILSLEIDEQNSIFNGFFTAFETSLDRAIEAGTVDMGLENVVADKIEVKDELTVRKYDGGAETKYVQMTAFRKPQIMSYKQIEDYLPNFKGLVRMESGEVRAVYQMANKTENTGEIVEQYRLQSPVLTTKSVYVKKTLDEKTTPIPKKEWMSAWNEQTAKAPEFTEQTLHLLTGTLLPIWNRLPTENTRVMRVITSDGRQYLGRLIKNDQIDSVLKVFGVGRTKEVYTPEDVHAKILGDGYEAVLEADKQKLVRRRVSGENRIEIVGNNIWFYARFPGVISEKINYTFRYFIPTNSQGVQIIKRIMDNNPIVELVKGTRADDEDGVRAKILPAAAQNATPVKLKEYSEHQKTNWQGSKKIILYENRAQLEDFIETAISDGSYQRKMYFGMIPDALSMRVKSETGIDISEYNLVLRADEIRKILRDHGDELKEAKHGQRAINRDDFISIPEIVVNPDSIELSNKLYDGKPTLLFKKVLNGKTVAVAHASIQTHDLTVQTMYAGKNKGSLATTPSGVSPFSHTPEALSSTASNENVSQSGDGVKYALTSSEWDVPQNTTPAAVRNVMSLANMINKIRHDFGISITTGNIRKQGAAGVYLEKPGTIRTRIANDLLTVTHELGHHFDELYGLSDASDAVLTEITGNLPQDTKDRYTDEQLPGEGVAEFVSRYLSDKAKAEEDYPLFYPWFTQKLLNEELMLLDGLADEVNNYLSADLSARSSAAVNMPGDTRDFRTLGEKAGEKADAVYQANVDSNHGIKRFADFADDQNVYRVATNAAYADSVASANIMYNLTDINGKKVGLGLKQALQGINVRNRQEFRDFNEYLKVKHGPERLKEGLMVSSDPMLNKADFMNFRAKELEHKYPKFAEAAQRVYTFNQQLLQTWAVDTGLIAPETAQKWFERWQYYVPFNRVMDDDSAGPSVKRGFANQRSPFKKAVGSGRDIIAPIESIARNATKLIQAAIKNNVMVEVTTLADKNNGSGAFLEKVPAPLTVTKYNAVELKKKLKVELMEGLPDEAVDAAFEIVNSTVDDILIQYGRGKAFGDTVTVMKDGKPQFWQINDAMMLESVTSMTPARMPAFIEAYGRITRFITSNITGNNILWSIFSNLPRDIATFWNYSENKNPITILGNIASGYANNLKAYTGKGRIDPYYLEYMAMGGGSSNSLLTADRDNAARAMDRLFAYNSAKYLNPLEWVEAFSNAIEGGPRFAYYRMRRMAGKTTSEAFYDAMEITTNFKRHGTQSQQINKIVPFYNASVQGLDRFARWVTASDAPKDMRGKVIAKRWSVYIASGLFMALAQVLAARRRDEEGYEQLSAYVKNNYLNIPLGNGKFFSIPKPRELGALSTTFERILEQYMLGNDKAFNNYDEYITSQFLPPVMSGVAKAGVGAVSGDSEKIMQGGSEALGDFGLAGTLVAMLANRDFRGNPIVSKGMMMLEPRAQFNNRTSKIAIAVGNATNMSPLMIDYFLTSTLGGFWKVVKSLWPENKSERDLTLGIEASYIKDSRYSTDIVNDFYDQRDKADKFHATYSENAEYKIAANDYDDMATFYSRYNALAKSSADTLENLQTRQMVIEMLEQFVNEQESGQRTTAKKALDELAASVMSTTFYPQVMPQQLTIGEGGKKETHQLTAAQYVEYQTVYLDYYWQEVTQRLNRNYRTDEEKAKAVTAGKATAAELAKRYMAKKLGVRYF
jgi:hypothetical protein